MVFTKPSHLLTFLTCQWPRKLSRTHQTSWGRSPGNSVDSARGCPRFQVRWTVCWRSCFLFAGLWLSIYLKDSTEPPILIWIFSSHWLCQRRAHLPSIPFSYFWALLRLGWPQLELGKAGWGWSGPDSWLWCLNQEVTTAAECESFYLSSPFCPKRFLPPDL